MKQAAVKYLLFLILPLAILSCSKYYSSVSRKNVAFLYHPGKTLLHPEFSVYHNSDTASLLMFRIDTRDLTYLKSYTDDTAIAKVSVHYQLLSSSTSIEVLDSNTTTFEIMKDEENNLFVSSIPISTKLKQNYFLKIETKDLYSIKTTPSFLDIDKSSKYNHENFLVVSEGGIPFYRKYFNKEAELKIVNERVDSKNIFVKYYDDLFSFARPPFSLSQTKAYKIEHDSLWNHELTDSTYFQLPDKGMYFIQVDTTIKEGVALFNYGKYYPQVKTPTELLKPLRYLTTAKEFKELKAEKYRKRAIDNFWLDKTGNHDRARALIKIYYSRVTLANVYFTSYTEGWKTDRGMIYTVYGPPTTIYKNDDSEVWIYGSSNIPAMNFSFKKVENAFTDNDYALIRYDYYKSSWYQSVETWRNGRPFVVGK